MFKNIGDTTIEFKPMADEDLSKQLEMEDPDLDSENEDQLMEKIHQKRIYNNLVSKMIRRKLNRQSFMKSNMGREVEKALDCDIQFSRRKLSQSRIVE